jgi:hypothetical protein
LADLLVPLVQSGGQISNLIEDDARCSNAFIETDRAPSPSLAVRLDRIG